MKDDIEKSLKLEPGGFNDVVDYTPPNDTKCDELMVHCAGYLQ
jgi:hypothetical protein